MKLVVHVPLTDHALGNFTSNHNIPTYLNDFEVPVALKWPAIVTMTKLVSLTKIY